MEKVNMSFLIDKKLKYKFDDIIKKSDYKNTSDALNFLTEDFIKNYNFNIKEDEDKKIFGFRINKDLKKKIIFYSNNSKDFNNATDLIKKVIKKYLEENDES